MPEPYKARQKYWDQIKHLAYRVDKEISVRFDPDSAGVIAECDNRQLFIRADWIEEQAWKHIGSELANLSHLCGHKPAIVH
jgi:hypothetical protein